MADDIFIFSLLRYKLLPLFLRWALLAFCSFHFNEQSSIETIRYKQY